MTPLSSPPRPTNRTRSQASPLPPSPRGWKGYAGLLKEAGNRWVNNKCPRLGAALSYYTAFSIAPLLLLAMTIVGFVFGQEAAQGQVQAQLSGLLGSESAETIQSMIQASQKPAAGVLSAVIGVISLLLGASGVMTEMKDALNDIWDVKVKSGVGFFVRTRLKAIGMVLAVGFVLLVSLVVSAMLAGFGKFLGGFLPVPEAVLHAINFVVSFGIVALLFAMLFRILPDADIRWRDVGIGAGVTSFLFMVGKFALGLYLGKGAIGSSYGAAGAVLVTLAWVYYSAQIFYFGAEFTRVYADRYGAGIRTAT